MKARNRLALEVKVKVDSLIFPAAPFVFTETGTFKEGDLAINKNGMLIKPVVPQPSPTPKVEETKGSLYALQDFQEIKSLGQGSGGIVRKVVHAPTGQLAALKVVALDVNEQIRKHIITELRILYNSKSIFVVSLFDAYYTEGSVYMALEYMDAGSLTDLVKAKGKLPEDVVASIAIQAIQGLTYLQKTLRIVHRDIKPSNILLNTKGQVKIADFGVSSLLANTAARAATWVGTVTYMSPERLLGAQYSFNSDVWALGLTLMECVLGYYPYSNSGEPIPFFELMNGVVKNDPPALPSDEFSPEFCSFIATCLHKDVAMRLNPDQLAQHPFITKNSSNPFDLSKYVRPLDP